MNAGGGMARTDVTVRSRVTGLERAGDAWRLEDGREEAGFDAVLVTFLPAQAAELPDISSAPEAPTPRVYGAEPARPRWSLTGGRFDAPFDGASSTRGCSWVSRAR